MRRHSPVPHRPRPLERVGRALRERAAARRELAALLDELAEHAAPAVRNPANLRRRACPVCAADDVEPDPALRGPVYAFHRCRRCRLLYVRDLLRPEAMRQLYAERPIYRRYWNHMRADAEAMRGRAVYGDLIRQLLAATPGRGTAIDVGCGFGKLVAELTPHFEEAFGLELNRRTAQTGRELFEVPIRSERLERIDRPDGSVDLIVMNQILEHLGEVRPVVAAAARLLRPGGVLWIGVPHGASLGMRLRKGGHRFVAAHVHVNLFEAGPLARLAEDAGFQVERLSTDDQLDLALADGTAARPLLFAPALAFERALRLLSSRTHLASRLGIGAHLEATLRRP